MTDFTITVNDKSVPVKKGQTVLEASLAAGIDIPVFCWHPQMDPVGACRICLVEIEKFPKLQVACATMAQDGMVVHTESPKVVKARRGVLEFILAHHPLDCPTCDKGGECDLQDITFKYGLDYSRLKEPKHRFVVDEDSTFDDLRIGPEVIRNQNRCIHCYRCTRIVEEVAFEDDLGAYQRGYHTEILPPPGREIRNLYSGNVVEYCPVGALTNTDWRYKVRVWLTEQTPVVCPHCPDGCNMTLWTYHDKLYRATSRPNEAIDKGFLCDIGRYGYQYMTSNDRLKQPMVRKEGELVETSWDEALDFIKAESDDCKKKLSGSGFFGFVGAGSYNEEIYAFQRFLRRVIGTNNIDHRLHRKRRLDYSKEITERKLGPDATTFGEIEKADTIVVFGSDLHSENPITALRVKRAIRYNEAQLIIINPLPTHLAVRTSAIEAIHNPGTGGVALTAITGAVLDRIESDPAAHGLASDDIKEFRRQHGGCLGEKGRALTGLDAELIEKIAEAIVKSENAVILTGAFYERDSWRDSLMLAVTNLRKAFKRCKLVNLPEESNTIGADMLGALPGSLPGRCRFDEKAEFEDTWRGPLTDMVGRDTIGILEAINEDEIECGFVLQADPVRRFPDGGYAHKVMEKLKLLVVIDSFMTDTARVADVILPVANFGETEGTRMNWEGRLQYSAEAVKPIADSKPACEIIELLSDKLGTAFNQATSREVYPEMARFLPDGCPGSFDNIPQEGVMVCADSADPSGGFAPFVYNPVAESKEYPFHLITVNADHHRGTLTERADSLMNFCNEPYVGLNVQDADDLKLSDGDLVKVESSLGKVVGKTHRIQRLPRGRVVMPDNFSELQANVLMGRKERYDRVKLSKM